MNDSPNDPQQKCGAKTRSGSPCEHWPIRGRTRCLLHGGRSLAGPASATWRHGRRSRYLPRRLAEKFQEALHDPDLVSLIPDLATLDARLAELLQRLERGGESGAVWHALADERRALVAAKARDDKTAAAASLSKILALIDKGGGEETLWEQIQATLELRRRLVSSEAKRAHDARTSLSLDEVVVLVSAIAEAIKTTVVDPVDRRHILMRMNDLLVLPGGRTSPSYFDPDDDDNDAAI